MKRSVQGFTLFELIIEATLGGITLACIMQFFITQLNQYRLIAGNNQLSENVRIFSKFFEKDTHNSLAFYVFDNLTEALSFKRGDEVTLPKVGNCVVFVTERGLVSSGKGLIYYVDENEASHITINGTVCWPFYRAIVSFKPSGQINETENTLSKLPFGYIKGTEDNFFKKFTYTNPSTSETSTGIFYTIDHKRFDRNDTSAQYPHIAGCRHGIYFGATLVQPGLKGSASETPINFCFFSRNPRF